MIKAVTVMADNREKFPVTFPATLDLHTARNVWHIVKITVKRAALKTGDYYLKDFRSTCLIERKGSMEELIACVAGNDVRRFRNQLDRLAYETVHPYLLLDISLSQLTRNSRHSTITYSKVIDLALIECTRRKIPVIGPVTARTTNSRRKLGEYLVRLMLSHVLNHGSPAR